MPISFYSRFRSPHERELIEDCLMGPMASDGDCAARVQGLFQSRLHTNLPFLTPSCTHALELALGVLHLKSGDEVILPSYNFPSAGNAVLLAGGTPVLCDVDPDTQNLDIDDMQRRITPRTRAVITVHYGAVSCDMDRLVRLANETGLILIEDAAQAVGAFYKGRHLGTIGDFGAYSFHSTKNISCGEGGALTCAEKYRQQAELYRECGTNRSGYLRGESGRYAWTSRGSSLILSEWCACLLYAQLLSLEEITSRRLELCEAYRQALLPLEESGRLRLMSVPPDCSPNGHLFYVRFDGPGTLGRVQNRLHSQGIDARTHYVPLHMSPMGHALGYRDDDLPASRRAYETLLRLPVHPNLSVGEAQQVAQVLAHAL
ncbi:dTDP-4-amino-4,6-dideoxygalactose transaminase [Harryflintia acetispora]|uniref:dTDP-4-amino-4,6-dideoxygalactose transaminase n=1 Tax=Harryflintia acetispora TaxID=1849041 RepID=UPI0018981E2B|nr:dTDP-4-amino-4,6-dideoxygalactose transaminase [Harryflintia acetispora]